jgi:predicted transglutaminase-like cysteine proteinase
MVRTALFILLLAVAACADQAIPASSPLPTSGSVIPPAQWLQFCQRHPEYQPCSMANP